MRSTLFDVISLTRSKAVSVRGEYRAWKCDGH